MQFDWTISFGSVIATSTALIAGLLAWRDLGWRVKVIEDWKDEHVRDSEENSSRRDHVAEEAIRSFNVLRDAVVELKAMVQGQDRRMIMLEDRERWSKP